jgi:putative addiction module component (TIGR02574 family)
VDYPIEVNMDRDFDSVIEDALSLNENERHQLVERLNQSFQTESGNLRTNLKEAKRRFDAYDRGEIGSVDAREALARVRKLRDQHRSSEASPKTIDKNTARQALIQAVGFMGTDGRALKALIDERRKERNG